MSKWVVDQAKASQLNLRKGVVPAEIIAVLAAGTVVEKLAEVAGQTNWWQVRAEPPGGAVTGFLNSDFLAPKAAANTPPAAIGQLPPSHLSPRGHRRRDEHGRAFPLDESGMPTRGAPDPAMTLQIAGWLKPDSATHKRWWPGNNQTFCNIYAYDFCQRMGVFLPRVWWTATAIQAIKAGQQVQVAYGSTVTELNANALHDWCAEFGPGFGWTRVFTPGELQSAANAGKAGIIVAKRHDLGRSGHIVAVLPETPALKAAVSGGEVVRPVQSQAGSRNFTAEVPTQRWWLGSQFQSFGFWVHD